MHELCNQRLHLHRKNAINADITPLPKAEIENMHHNSLLHKLINPVIFSFTRYSGIKYLKES